MAKFKLAFGIHNHQPVGNFEHVFEEAHRNAYLPFLRLLSSHPNLRISLHQSGILWDWQKDADPGYFELVGKMVDRGQLELMTGGYYEPILISIPERDAFGQIDRLNGFLKDHFGCETSGLWLTERIWEPHLPKLLAQAGVGYLPVDDTHFIYAGFESRQLTGPFVTESEGETVILLPIQKQLRYLIPFGKIEKVIDELKSQAELNPAGLAIYADDGEKFGVWPGTHKHCYQDGWLRQFFEAAEKEADWLELVPLREAAQEKPVGLAYLPSASYEEMLHWALPPDAFLEYEAFQEWLESRGVKERYGRFVRGGHWRGFLAKYEESNLMHKKMLRISGRLASLEQSGAANEPALAPIREHLYSAQCNCAYWHGVFGGLYLPHLRLAVYGHLIEATRGLRRLSGETESTLELVDFDQDGQEEVAFESDQLTAVIKPERGGTLAELCLCSPALNLTDTLTRRREGYHRRLDRATTPDDQSDTQKSIHDLVLTKEAGLAEYLVEDWYLKRCFIDHFLAGDVDLARFGSGKLWEEGDFILEPFACVVDAAGGSVALTRDGSVRRPDGEFPVRLAKEYYFDECRDALEVRYELSSVHPGGVDVVFAVENNFNFQAGHTADRYVSIDGERPAASFLDSTGAVADARTAALVDEYRSVAVAVGSDRAADIWHLPIFTVSLSEGGFEKVYQGTTLVHRFTLHLNSEPCRLSFVLRAGSMKQILKQAFSVAQFSG